MTHLVMRATSGCMTRFVTSATCMRLHDTHSVGRSFNSVTVLGIISVTYCAWTVRPANLEDWYRKWYVYWQPPPAYRFSPTHLPRPHMSTKSNNPRRSQSTTHNAQTCSPLPNIPAYPIFPWPAFRSPPPPLPLQSAGVRWSVNQLRQPTLPSEARSSRSRRSSGDTL